MASILVPLDGSPLAAQVIPYVQSLAKLLAAQVELVHVITPGDHYHVAMERGLLDEVRRDEVAGPKAEEQEILRLRDLAGQYLEAQAKPLRDSGLIVGTSVLDGPVAEAIVAAASDMSMIAMATHGYSGLRRWALGSVTDRVLHTAQVPVFVFRAGQHAQLTPRRIIVPLDGSDLARKALPQAIAIARAAKAELVLLTVVPPPLSEFDPGLVPEPLSADQRGQVSDRLVRELADAGHDVGGLKVTPVVIEGFVGEAIADEATREGADLIVMSSHGYGGWRRWALGSVADKVLHVAAAPLLLVRDPEAKG